MAGTSSFCYRVALLLGLMAIVAGVDFYRNGVKSIKFREYGFVLVAGLLGAIVGAANDFMTSNYSPEYFVWGKGLLDNANLRRDATLLGLRVGFSAGIIGGAICLFACRGKSAHPPATFSSMFGNLWMPVAGAIVGGIVIPVLFSKIDPARFSLHLDFLGPLRLDRFRRVWWINTGLYAGLLLGLGAMILDLRKKKSRISPAHSDEISRVH